MSVNSFNEPVATTFRLYTSSPSKCLILPETHRKVLPRSITRALSQVPQ
jgi:hypothetical protein